MEYPCFSSEASIPTSSSDCVKTLSSFAYSAFQEESARDGDMTSGHSSCASRSNKGRVKGHAVRHLVREDWENVRTFGGIGGEYDSENSDIQSYSDENSSSNANADIRSSSGAFVTHCSDDEEVSVKPVNRAMTKSISRKRIPKLLQLSSTPIRHKGVPECGIDDFDSGSSASGDDAHPVVLTLNRRSKRFKAFGPPTSNHTDAAIGLQWGENICSPPSSPEMDDTETDTSRLKTSDWIKRIRYESMDSSKPHELSDGLPTPLDSAKRRGSSLKLTEGGLAERVLKLVQKEKSELTFWEHKVKNAQADEVVDESSCVTVQVLLASTCCSVVIAKCKVLPDDSLPQHRTICPPGETWKYLAEDEVTVMFAERTAQFLHLRAGDHVRIRPPWTLVRVLSQEVILSPHFCQHVGHSPLPTSANLKTCTKSNGVWKAISLCGGYHMPSRPPAKELLPQCFFSESGCSRCVDQSGRQDFTHSKNANQRHESAQCSYRSDIICGDHLISQSSGNLLDAVNSVSELTATIVCWFRRRTGRGSSIDMDKRSLCYASPASDLMGSCGRASGWRWSLLVRDGGGDYAEIRMPCENERNQNWCALIEDNAERQYCFTNLRVVKKHDRLREPHLFSWISSQQPLGAQKHHYCVCVCLHWMADTQFSLCAASAVTSPGSTQELQNKATYDSVGVDSVKAIRITITAKIMRFQSEVPERLEFGIGSYNICGHYLYVTSTDSALHRLAKQGETSSLSHHSGGYEMTQDDSLWIELYLRPGFIIDGLEDILNSPGSTVLLRDVDVKFMKGQDVCYAMDVCSLVIPICPEPLNMLYPLANQQASSCNSKLGNLEYISPPS